MKKNNMKLTQQSKRNLRTIAIFTSLTSAGAIINALIEHGWNLFPVVNEFVIGFIFGIVASVFEIYVFEKQFRRLNFTSLLFIRTLFYVLICTLLIMAVAASRIGYEANIKYYEALNHGNFISFITSGDFAELLVYSVVLSFFVNFIRQIDRLLGQNVLLNYISGRYQPPIEEELIIMFLDLKSSTTIAERIGLIKNHQFLNDFFHDMTASILECRARVYQYVGDEVVLTWKLKEGVMDLNCIRCFYLIQNYINERKDVYIEKYGVYPEFKAGIHFGKVIAGEIGDVKKDIVLHGDTMNTTARIQAECNKYGKKLLSSGE
ncbi:MAG: adenylate/guanylate cyclase domain-containing protein, partial [Ignavibacteria bacterium]